MNMYMNTEGDGRGNIEHVLYLIIENFGICLQSEFLKNCLFAILPRFQGSIYTLYIKSVYISNMYVYNNQQNRASTMNEVFCFANGEVAHCYSFVIFWQQYICSGHKI